MQDDFSMEEMVSFLGGVAEDAGELSLAQSQFAYDRRGEAVSVRMERVDRAWVGGGLELETAGDQGPFVRLARLDHNEVRP